MQLLATILSEFLILPYVGWGIYLLRKRYRYHDELPVMVEVGTLAAVAAFYFLEWRLLRVWADRESLVYLFALLGLFLSGLALYGHVVVSLLSRFVVDLVVDADESRLDTPRFGPAEALERCEDYEGALIEYLVLAKTFPRHHAVLARVAENMVRLARFDEAADWLRRAAACALSSRDAWTHSVRLAEVQTRYRTDSPAARLAMQSFLVRFPASAEAVVARQRLEGLTTETKASAPLQPEALDALYDAPVAEASTPSEALSAWTGEPDAALTLESMDDPLPIPELQETAKSPAGQPASALPIEIEAIDAPLPSRVESDNAPRNGRSPLSLALLGDLEPMDRPAPSPEKQIE